MKTHITLLLVACLVLLPLSGNSGEGPSVRTISVMILDPAAGHPIVLPDEIPAELRGEVLAALKSAPPQFIQGLAAWIVVIVIVVVVGIIIYCLWKCSQMIRPVNNNTPPEDPTDPYPAFTGVAKNEGRPLFLINTNPAPTCDLQTSEDLRQWTTLATFSADAAAGPDWRVLKATSPHGLELARRTVRGSTTNNPISLTSTNPVTIPAASAEKMFFRLVAH